MVNIQDLCKKGVREVYIEVSSKESVETLLNNLDSIKYFTNARGWTGRNAYLTERGSMKYIVLNLASKEIAFNRVPPPEELFRTKLFVNEADDFSNVGPKKKLTL